MAQAFGSRREPPSRPKMIDTFDRTALFDVIEPVCRAHGVELVDVTLTNERGAVLRVLIDRERPRGAADPSIPPSGISLEDCQGVSRDLSTVLDVHERLVPSARYRLEVSSPGVDRPLVRPRDFERFVGVEVRVHTKLPLDEGGRRKVQGRLTRFEAGSAHVEDEASKATWVIPLDNVSKAHVVFRFR